MNNENINTSQEGFKITPETMPAIVEVLNKHISSESGDEANHQLKSIIERIENLEADKADVMLDIKSVYDEAGGYGYDAKILRKIVAIRKKDEDTRIEEEAIMDLYMQNLGMI